MAATQQARVSVSVHDQLGTKATIPLYALIDPATLVSDLAAMEAALVTDLKAVLGAALDSVEIVLIFPETDTADAGSRVEQTAVLDYIVTASGRQHGVAIAGWLDGLVGTGGQPTTGTGVGATAAAALTGALPGTATGVWTNNAFQPLGALHDSFLSFRKRRRSLMHSSDH